MTAVQLSLDTIPGGRPRDVVWRCPRCPHTETQPAHASAVVHLCGKGQHPTRLKRQGEAER